MDNTVTVNLTLTLRVADYFDQPDRVAAEVVRSYLDPQVRDLHDWRGQHTILSGYRIEEASVIVP